MAHADAIDGDWCRGADTFKIEGSAILTTGRAAVQGAYNRYQVRVHGPARGTGCGWCRQDGDDSCP